MQEQSHEPPVASPQSNDQHTPAPEALAAPTATLDAPAGVFGGQVLPGSLRTQLENSYAADLSAVTVHEDGVAEKLGVKAVARGTQLHFARGAFDPGSDTGKHIIAHEAAHVVQQGAVSSKAPAADNAQLHMDGSLEQEAEAAAHAALAGTTAKISRGVTTAAFQGFDSYEHRLLGDIATGGATYKMGAGLTLTHGDFVMLNGDYFDCRPDGKAEDNILLLVQTPSSNPGQMVGTQDEVIAAIKDAQKGGAKHGNGNDPRFGRGGEWEHVQISDAVNTAMNDRFKRLALHNREHFAHPTKDGPEGPRLNAGGSYRALHETALMEAFNAGNKGADVGGAMILEACGQHFLTDAFSSGHMRTQRADLQQHWDGKYPGFRESFVHTLGELVGRALLVDASIGGKAMLVGAGALLDMDAQKELVKVATEKARAAIGQAGPPGFGDIVCSLLHDADNVAGLWVTNDLGWKWIAMGDDNMLKGPASPQAGGRTHFDIIRLAVELGCADIRHAYALGQTQTGMPREHVLLEVMHRAAEPAKASADKFAAEQIIPRQVEGANGEQAGMADNFDALLKQKPRSTGDLTFDQAIKLSAKGGTIHEQLESVAEGLDEDEAGVLHPRQAFEDGVVSYMKNEPIKLLKRILGE